MKIVYQPHQYAQQRQREKKRWIWPVVMAMEATKMRNDGHQVYWDTLPEGSVYRIVTEPEQLDKFLEMPAPDRYDTDAANPKYQNNGNYKYHPGTYIQSAVGCWWGKCVFCKENGVEFLRRPVDDVIAEIKECRDLGYKEIFDDAASLGAAEWRREFVAKLKPLNITFSCNMRFGTLRGYDFIKLKDAGFRMLLYGLESANQDTLDGLHKGFYLDHAVKELMLASQYGLEPHIAYMVSYPWETLEEEMNTIKLVQWLLKKGYAKTAQCSVYCPPDGEICKDKAHLTSKLYNVAFMPEFWYNKFKDIKNVDDLKYLLRGIKEGLGAKWGEK